MSKYAKSLVASLIAVLYAGLTAWQANVGSGHFHAVALFPVTAAVGAAVLTYVIPNVPELPYAKAVVTGVLQAVAALAVLYQDGGVTSNVVAALLAIVSTVVVHQVPNAVPATARVALVEA